MSVSTRRLKRVESQLAKYDALVAEKERESARRLDRRRQEPSRRRCATRICRCRSSSACAASCAARATPWLGFDRADQEPEVAEARTALREGKAERDREVRALRKQLREVEKSVGMKSAEFTS